ncbi:SusF/SusE family outer membrane protein [Flavobacterium sp. Root901]|uniref:SusF/SusE family outer membrane protein n=1 Tax=Flavobacterium sp. Root901 TaxID=1736605 RepID=UPI0009E83FCB|nr:SusF/SusE family outer membrane protein [Flavobacterium sp. Root901]
MKNIKNIISFIIMSLVLVSCTDGGLENADWLKQPDFANPLTITLSNKEVVLAKDNEAENAITFTWTQGNERGAGTSLTYFFRMDIVGNNFGEGAAPGTSTTITEEIPAGIFTKSYTVGQLNSLLLKNFKRPGGVVTNLEVQIIARVDNSAQYQLPEVSTSSFAVTSYSPGPLPLFMVGDAVSGGWDYSTGKSLPEKTERTIYNFTGDFSIGSFKVIEKPGSELPSYDPAAENKIVYNETEPRNNDNVFKVTEAGRHSFYLDIDQGIYAFGYVPYENVYMVGNAITGIGWDIGRAKPMTWDPKNPEVFVYKGQFDAGEFKLPLELGNWNGKNLMPPTNGTVLKGNASDNPTMLLMPNGNPDNKWIIETAGQYELTVNPAKMTIVLKKL